MKKGLLLFCMSILTCVCIAQNPGIHPPSKIFIDSTQIFTGFIHSIDESGKVILSWTVQPNDSIDFFSVERSGNGKDFELVQLFKSTPGNKIEFIDEVPNKGRSYYRLKGSVKGKEIFSKVQQVYMIGDITFRFYPNPADNVLIIRSEIPVDVQIADAKGEVRISMNRIQGLQTINVSSLEKGVYMIRFTNKISNTITIEKLIKN